MLGPNNNALAPRMAGVKIAREVVSERKEPNKLLGVMDVQLKAVAYTDASGVEQTSMFFVTADGQMLSTLDSEEWCRKLRNMAPWLAKAYETYMQNKAPVEVPDHDNVDPLET